MLAGVLSPRLEEALARLATWLPSFARAAQELAYFTGVTVGEATARRHTQAAGGAYVAVQTAEVERLEREQPSAPQGPAVQQVSVDGALVPLVGGTWAEVKTVAIGTVESVRGAEGLPEVHARDLSYFSRLADADTFTRLALVEIHRRGVETAGTVCGVMDGADWLQGFLDVHRPDAVRILDFPHAVEHLTVAAQGTYGLGTPETLAWVQQQAQTLKHEEHGAAMVLRALAALPVYQANAPVVAAEARDAALTYLTKRLPQVQYAVFQAQGFPIGNGSVESANKLVVEARLKGSGMHWARAHVDPMLALRTVVCADRWAEAWPQIEATLRQQRRERRAARRSVHQTAPQPAATSLQCRPAAVHPVARATPSRPKLVVRGRPTAAHPWKRPLLAGGRRYAAAHPKI